MKIMAFDEMCMCPHFLLLKSLLFSSTLFNLFRFLCFNSCVMIKVEPNSHVISFISAQVIDQVPMRVRSLLCQGLFFLSLLILLHAVSLCGADDTTRFEVVGTGECADCKENNIKTTQAFSGLHVTIDCKLKVGDMKRIGESELDKQGNFKVSLPQDLGEKLDEHECYAQLHSAASTPCLAHNGLEASKIVFKSQTNGKHIYVPTKNIQFSAALCTSKFFWPHFKHPPLPPLKHLGHPWLLPPLPPLYKPPPVPVYEPPVVKPLPPPAPVYESPVVKPLPPSAPTYKPKPEPKPEPPVGKSLPPPAPIYKPKPKPPIVKPPVPIYKPKPPVYKPPVEKPPIYKPPVYKPPVYKPPVYKPPVEKPPVYKPPVEKPPVYKPPVKPPVYKPPVYKPPVQKPPVYKPPVEKPPVYKPPIKPPVYKPPVKPPVEEPPVYKPPVDKPPIYKPPVVNPLPPPIPIYKPPVIKKPLPPHNPLFSIPPITKKPCPPLPKLPPLPKIPPEYFHHPKFGYFPPLPPTFPHA